MAKSIDLKSLLVGGLLALSVLCVLGATPRLLSSEAVGRFTIILSNLPGGDGYVLDTATGQVWPKYSNGNTEAFYAPKLKVRVAEEPNVPKPRTRKSQIPGRSDPQ
jgi:hypothetical protein